MNFFDNILPDEIINAIGWALFHSIWQFLLIAVFLSIMLSILSRFSSHFRYFVASMGYVFFLSLAIITFIRNYEKTPEQTVTTIQSSNIKPIQNTIHTTIKQEAEEVEPTTSKLETWINKLTSFSKKRFPLLVHIWLLGIVILSLRFLGNLAYVHRLKNYRTIPVENYWLRAMERLKTTMAVKSTVKLAKSSLTRSPMVVGYLKPVILLPMSAVSGISVHEMECIIAHELAHIKRNDYLMGLLQKLVGILFFYHPAIWWISVITKAERENCCDDLAVAATGDSVSFVKAIAKMEEHRQSTRLAVAFTGQKNTLLKRVQRLLNQRKMKSNFIEGFIASGIVFLGIIAMAFTFGPKQIIPPTGHNTIGDTNSYDLLRTLESNDIATNPDSVYQEKQLKDQTEDTATQDIGNKTYQYEYHYKIKRRQQTNDEKEQVLQEREKEIKKHGQEIEGHERTLQEREEEIQKRRKELDQEYEAARRERDTDVDVEIIVREAMENARSALTEVDVDVIVDEAMRAAEEGLKAAEEGLIENEIERSIKDALGTLEKDLNEAEISAAIDVAIRTAIESTKEIDVDKIINKIQIEMDAALNGLDIHITTNQNNLPGKHKRILDQGVDAWNDWRNQHPEIKPNLIAVQLSEADLANANLENAKLIGADLSEADLTNASLRFAELQGVNLKGAKLKGALLEGANLAGADLKEVDISGMDLRNMKLIGINLKEATLEKCDLRDADLRGANMKETGLNGADLRYADLRGADLSEASVKGTNFKNIVANRNTLFPPGFDAEKEGVIYK